jgi:crossover junction endodeoxyribonuclease RusA
MTSRLPDQWTIRLLYPRPPKGLSLNDRSHWAVKAKSTEAVRLEVMTKVRALRIPALDRIRIDITWWVTDKRRRDVDNTMPFAKAIYDGVAADKGTSARIVDDDNPLFVEKVMPRIELAPKGAKAHFEVRITDLGDADG